ncbi:transporter substrate-binding domain-containing protein [Vibrio coralliilyticus]|uniref:substrate-binding periplasmic protein n=1 Tax=Vibrio coralliilyticus TaxID=190893 RepID=UPI00148B3977|nr:transporter substrate-binding domain-containing protein [Vibrio coralliilyticus]NOI17363.1 transporter substrate-binding domain-containing protein [Vibrio coralliilyticus]
MRVIPYIIALLFITTQCYGKQIIIGYSDLEFPPYIVGAAGSVNAKSPGVTVETLRLVSREIGVDIVFKRAPWSRVLKMAKHNRVDAIFHASFSTARTEFLEYPMKDGDVDKLKYLKRQRYFLYKPKGATIYSKGGKLYQTDGKIGATTNYSIIAKLEKQGIAVKEATSAYKGLELLSKGRINGWVGLESITDKIINDNSSITGIIKEKLPLSDQYSYLAFSKDFYSAHPDLAQALWARIEAFTTSKRYFELFDKYQ